MSGFTLAVDLFHFLRPWLLLLAPMILVLWWLVRRRLTQGEAISTAIAPHLRDALTVGRAGQARLLPIDGVMIGLLLAVTGAAGPTWSRVPDPFVAQIAPLVIAMKVTPSMETPDVAPTRLARGKQKVRDLLALRAGGRTALVAYAGSAHSVVPMTDDPDVMQPYLEGLSPDIMPKEGDNAAAALEMAQAIMADETTPGGILFITDALPGSDVSLLDTAEGTPVALLAMLPDGTGDAGIDALNIPVEQVTADETDITRLDRNLNAAYMRALAEEGDQPWDDRGWLLAWPAALLALIWFRRGWTMRWGFVMLLAAGIHLPSGARAGGIADWFLTPDQQGQIAYDRKNFERAAELYLDPMHKGYALYRDGQYDAAYEVLARVETADAAFLQGMATIKNRRYRDAITAFETALERDPDFPGAAENLDLARQILDYVETTREQSDTGEDTGIGADDVVFDNDDARGADTQIEATEEGAELLTGDQWMNTVDTQTADFLRQRFAIEAARQ